MFKLSSSTVDMSKLSSSTVDMSKLYSSAVDMFKEKMQQIQSDITSKICIETLLVLMHKCTTYYIYYIYCIDVSKEIKCLVW